MVRWFSRPLLFLLTTGLFAASASAELYTLRLKNGTSFSSRQQPQFAAWDKDVVLVLTEVGNWVAIDAKNVERVEVETQVRGFARRLDVNTLFLGWAANDGTGNSGGVALPPEQRQYDQQQFVDPSQAGGGFPTLGGGNSTSSGNFTDGGFVPPQAPAPPAQAPAPEPSGQQ